MNRLQRAAIKAEYVTLVNDLLVCGDSTFLPFLVEKEVLTADDQERIEKQVTTNDKAKKFLDILLNLKPNPNSSSQTWEIFLDALWKSQDHLFDILSERYTKLLQDASLIPPNTDVKNQIQEELSLALEIKEGASIVMRKVIQYLQNKNIHCTVKDVKSAVQSAFPFAELQYDKDTKDKNIWEQPICNLSWKLQISTATGDLFSQETNKHTSDWFKTSEMEDWDRNDVRSWLHGLQFHEDTANCFHDEEIDGHILKGLKTEELKSNFPNISFGACKRILEKRDGYLEMQEIYKTNSDQKSMCSIPLEAESGNPFKKDVFRKFDQQDDITFKYKKFASLPVSLDRVSNLIVPIHRYVSFALLADSVKDMYIFGKEVVTFACACLNDRTNATIHFGVVNGKVHGFEMPSNRELLEFGETLSTYIKKSFSIEQQDIVKNCIRPPKFVEVLDARAKENVYVVEVDIVPEYELCKEEAFFVKPPNLSGNKADGQRLNFANQSVFRLDGAEPISLSIEKFTQFMEFKADLSRLRKERELNKIPIGYPDLGRKLTSLLCRGEDTLNGDVYPVLVINAPDKYMDLKFLNDKFSFLKHIEWKAVFDFSKQSEPYSIHQFVEDDLQNSTKIIPTDDFNRDSEQNINQPDRLKNMLDDIKSSLHVPWLYVNGLSSDPMLPMEWKQKRSEGFKEAVRFFRQIIPNKRAIVVFLIVSKDYDVMVEAAEEFLLKFSDQWMIIVENDGIADPFLEGLIKRNVAERNTLRNRLVVGMPWNHVQETIIKVTNVNIKNSYELPTSSGTTCVLKERVHKELVDLEVLSQNQCEGSELAKDPIKLKKHKRLVEEQFYMGGQVNWWNFWFPNHVLQRSEHQFLQNKVHEALSGSFSNGARVFRVTLCHQPGAGGTTTARNILWDFRKSYRCAVVKHITDQTCDQISNLHMYEEECNPKPVLLLIDRNDEEKISRLNAELEENARKQSKKLSHPPRVYYILLVCKRRTSIPADHDSSRVLLKHELKEHELHWFKEKAKELERYFKNNEGVNPRFLLSFNILKVNFDKELIRNTVIEITKEIESDKERTLLLYIALLNAYDFQSQPVPLSSFDVIMETDPYSLSSEKVLWERQLSQAAKIFLNESLHLALGYVRAFTIINPLLSKELISTLKGDLSLTSLVRQFLDSDIFKSVNHSKKELLKIVRDIMKRRPRDQDGKYETSFSPIVVDILGPGNKIEDATDVLRKVLELSDDPFISQQMARLYMTAQDWQNAEGYARRAIAINNTQTSNQEHSYLLNTLGLVFKSQVIEFYRECMRNNNCRLRPSDIISTLDLIQKGLATFRHEQKVSENENRKYVSNNCGYMGEIEIVVKLLDILTFVEGLTNNSDLRKYLKEPDFVPDELEIWSDVNGRDYNHMIKNVQNGVEAAITHIEDEYLQLQGQNMDISKHTSQIQKRSLMSLQESLHHYFGEERDTVPKHLKPCDASHFRRERIHRLAGRTTYRLLALKGKSREKLLRVRDFAKQNIDSGYTEPYDLQTYLASNLALLAMQIKNETVNFSEMAKFSQSLYSKRDESKTIYLEPYLFAALFNWPRPNASLNRLTTAGHNLIPDILKEWKIAFYKKYPKQRGENPNRKKETVMYFLAKGSGMESIATYDEFRGGRGKYANIEFWQTKDAKKRLQRLKGVLRNDGKSIEFDLPLAGNVTKVSITTSIMITGRTWWNRPVSFVLGFSWGGPRGYDLTLDDPVNPDQSHSGFHMASPPTDPSCEEGLDVSSLSHGSFQKEISKLNQQLQKIKDLEQLEEIGETMTKKQLEEIKQRGTLLEKKENLIKRREEALLNESSDI